MSNRELTTSQLWAMSLAGISAVKEANNIHHLRLIGGWPDTENRQDWGRWVLKKLYGVESRDELLSAAKFFSEEGQGVEMVAGLAQLPRDPSADNYVQRLLRNNAAVIRRSGCKGWDIGRAATITGWSALGRYITEAEYWQLMKPMAEQAQRSYSSWQEYADGYELGRLYWAEGAEHKPTADAMTVLLSDPASLWVQLPWQTPLGQMHPATTGAAPQGASRGAADDVEIFPGQPVSRLTDYVNLMRAAQTGQIMQALSTLGLDMMAYSQVTMRWSQKMATDPPLATRFATLLSGG